MLALPLYHTKKYAMLPSVYMITAPTKNPTIFSTAQHTCCRMPCIWHCGSPASGHRLQSHTHHVNTPRWQTASRSSKHSNQQTPHACTKGQNCQCTTGKTYPSDTQTANCQSLDVPTTICCPHQPSTTSSSLHASAVNSNSNSNNKNNNNKLDLCPSPPPPRPPHSPNSSTGGRWPVAVPSTTSPLW